MSTRPDEERLWTESEAWAAWQRIVKATQEEFERDGINAEIAKWDRSGQLKDKGETQ